jgi:hypothetical protein
MESAGRSWDYFLDHFWKFLPLCLFAIAPLIILVVVYVRQPERVRGYVLLILASFLLWYLYFRLAFGDIAKIVDLFLERKFGS